MARSAMLAHTSIVYSGGGLDPGVGSDLLSRPLAIESAVPFWRYAGRGFGRGLGPAFEDEDEDD